MVFDHYDRIRIVNLTSRKDRRREMEAELARVGADRHQDIEFFPAFRPEDTGHFRSVGEHGCFLSQLGVLQEAARDEKSVLMLEDDCDFTELVKEFVPAPDTQILWGGYLEASDPSDLQNSDLIGAHFMAFSKDVVPRIVEFLERVLDIDEPFDPKVVRSDFDPALRPPVDGAYIWFRRYNPDVMTEFADLGIQRASASNIAHRKWFDNVPGLRHLANRLRRWKQSLG